MRILVEYKCPECKLVIEKFVYTKRGIVVVNCPVCGTEMERMYKFSVYKMKGKTRNIKKVKDTDILKDVEFREDKE